MQIIAEYDGAGDFVKRYIYGTGLDEVLLEIDGLDEVTSLHHDRVGSIIATTNDTGAVVNTYAYSPWGECDDMTGTTFGFQGQRFDHETGLYFMKARFYDPKIGRFLQPDPIGYADGLNLYEFGYNNPNSFSDPLGLAADPNNNPWGTPDPNYQPPPGWGEYPYGDPNYTPPAGWGNGYQYGNYHVGYDGGATIDIRLDDGTIIIVDLDAGGIITDVTPGHPGQVTVDLSSSTVIPASNNNGVWQRTTTPHGWWEKTPWGAWVDGQWVPVYIYHYINEFGEHWVYDEGRWWLRTGPVNVPSNPAPNWVPPTILPGPLKQFADPKPGSSKWA